MKDLLEAFGWWVSIDREGATISTTRPMVCKYLSKVDLPCDTSAHRCGTTDSNSDLFELFNGPNRSLHTQTDMKIRIR